MSYKIAIPSYKRHTTLKKKTMKVLEHYKVPPSIIHIFVANREEEKIYKETLEPNSYGKIIVGKPGIKEIRNFMAKYFREGEKVVYLDDDLSKIWRCITRDGGDPKNKKDNKLQIRNNDKWEFVDKKETIEQLINEKSYQLDTYYTNNKDKFENKHQDRFDCFQDKLTAGDRDVIKSVNTGSELIFWNSM